MAWWNAIREWWIGVLMRRELVEQLTERLEQARASRNEAIEVASVMRNERDGAIAERDKAIDEQDGAMNELRKARELLAVARNERDVAIQVSNENFALFEAAAKERDEAVGELSKCREANNILRRKIEGLKTAMLNVSTNFRSLCGME